MGTGMILLIVIGVLAVFIISIYNKLVSYRNRYKNAYAQIDVQLNRRYDLIPNLVETAKGYMSHEKDTLEAVIQARNQAASASKGVASNPGDPESMKKLMQAEGALGGTLGRLFALSESYPDLKANTTMSQLMEELTTTENKISFARQSYNDSVMQYNTAREVFPAVLVANNFGFTKAELFEVDSAEKREAVKVSF
jgi:LemA protein